MSGPAFLALRHARHHALRTALLVLCVFVSALVPLATWVLMSGFETALLARANATPLVVGAKGNRFDLTMSALYFRRAEMPTISMADYTELRAAGLGTAIPLNTRFTARTIPIVATSTDYFDLRSLRPQIGTLPLHLGDVVLGARAARSLGLTIGAPLFSDQRELYDISKPAALKMKVVGILSPKGTIDDEAVFVDIKTAWILEGLSHGHADARSIPDALVLDKSAANVAVSEALVDYNEVTEQNAATFHVHGDDSLLPLTAVIIDPSSEKDGTILKSRLNAGKLLQGATPEEVVRELLGYVLRLRTLLNAISFVLCVLTTILIALVTTLSVRVRAREIETLTRIGASRSTVASIFALEIGFVILAGITAAAGVAAGLSLLAPELVKVL